MASGRHPHTYTPPQRGPQRVRVQPLLSALLKAGNSVYSGTVERSCKHIAEGANRTICPFNQRLRFALSGRKAE